MAKHITVKATKRSLIDKANTNIVVITSIAVFIVIFSAVASKTLISQAGYQNRVIDAERTTLTKLKTNITASNNLETAYQAFNAAPENIIGGSSTGNGAQDGSNATIVLDSLPSSYDFPALTSSLEALLNNSKTEINTISGTDDEADQASNTSSASPKPVAIPFQVSVTGNYPSVQNLVGQFQNSIRPIQIQSLQISGDQDQLTMSISAQTFYQPAKTLKINSEVVK